MLISTKEKKKKRDDSKPNHFGQDPSTGLMQKIEGVPPSLLSGWTGKPSGPELNNTYQSPW